MVAVAGMLFAGSVLALPSDRTRPIDINADRISLNQATGMTVYEGHVTLTQGSLHIEADKITASTLAHGIRQIDAYGMPARFRELPIRGQPEIIGSARHLIYSAERHVLILKKHVRVRQGQDSFTGASMHYDLTTQQLEATGSTREGRIHTVITPKAPPSRNHPAPQ